MRTIGYLCIILLVAFTSCLHTENKNYKVETKDSANFSVLLFMLFPKEHLVVKINNEVVLDMIGSDSLGSPTSYMYFNYPDSIKSISVIGEHNKRITFQKEFKDTLINVARRSLVISLPFPKGMTKKTYKPYSYVPIKDADRNITLIDDAVQYKDIWIY